MKKLLKENKGITLIALVITIIILMILAGVTINLLMGHDGLINKAKKASNDTKRVSSDERLNTLLCEYSIAKIETGVSLENFLNEKLLKKEIDDIEITEEGIEIYIGNYYALVDSQGNVIEEMQGTGIKPEITYELSSTEAEQDNVIITVRAQIQDSTATITNIVNPNNVEIYNNEIQFEVNKNGTYKFVANTSLGTKKSCIVKITNIKISEPVITVTQNGGYPVITDHGITGGKSKVSIQYEQNDIYKNLYSEDNGTTWKEYKGETEVTSSKILAKTVIKDNELVQSSVTTQSISTPTDAIGVNAYDDDDTNYWTYSNTTGQTIGGPGANSTLKYNLLSGRMNIDGTAIGKTLRVKFTRSSNGWYGGIAFFNDSGTELKRIEKGQSGSCDETIEIPEGSTHIKCFTTADNGSVYIYDLKICNEPKINVVNHYSTLTSNGVLNPYNTATIVYDSTSVQKLYKINDGNWTTYNNQVLRLEIGDKLYAKGIDKNNNETRIVSYYESKIMTDAMGSNAFDNDDTSYWTYSNTTGQYIGSANTNSTLKYNLLSGRLDIDSSVYGKTLRVKFTRSSNGWYGGIAFFDASGTELKRIEKGQSGSCDETTQIPEGSTHIKCFTTADNGSVYIYDLKIVD